MHRYRPRGLIPSPPVSFPLIGLESEFPFVAEVVPLALSAFLPDPEVGWNALEHAWHVGLELAVSSTITLKNQGISVTGLDQPARKR